MGGKSRRPRFVFTKRTPDRVACGRRFYNTNPLVPVSGGARSRSGYKTKPRWAGSRAAPDSFSQNEPPTVWRAEGGFTIRTRSSRFPAVRGRSSGYKTKPRWAGSRANPRFVFTKRTPRPCGGRKAVLQFEPARPVSGCARSQSSATRSRRFTRQTCGVRHDQANAVLAETHASKIFEKSVFRIRSNNDGLDPVIADRLSLRDGSY